MFFRRLLTATEFFLCPFLAAYFYWLWWPIAYICKRRGIRFIVNIQPGAGHVLCEIDYFARLPKDPQLSYVWVCKKHPLFVTCCQLFGSLFSKAICNTYLYLLLLPMLAHYKDLTIDVGVSRWKMQLSGRPRFQRGYFFLLPKHQSLANICTYYKLRQERPGFPLATHIPETAALDEFIGEDPIALIHLRSERINATAAPTDPTTLLPTIAYLKNLGYRSVFIGREEMPACFKEAGVLNYAQSPHTSFLHDLVLAKRAQLAIYSSSGVGFLSDIQGKPYIWMNSWHLPITKPSPHCISLPCLVEGLTFREQFALYKNLPDLDGERFPIDRYRPRNATSDEILEATKELLSPFPPTPLQQQFRCLDPSSPIYWAQSQVSHHFLEKHKERF